jgi:RNAse (barnase) inhibitor barstar
MKAQIVRIDGSKITDWSSFHEVFARQLGFPNFYGRNMNAWIDCLSYRRDQDGMSSVNITPDEFILFQVEHAEQFRTNHPEGYAALLDCSATVNQSYIEEGQQPALAVMLL